MLKMISRQRFGEWISYICMNTYSLGRYTLVTTVSSHVTNGMDQACTECIVQQKVFEHGNRASSFGAFRKVLLTTYFLATMLRYSTSCTYLSSASSITPHLLSSFLFSLASSSSRPATPSSKPTATTSYGMCSSLR